VIPDAEIQWTFTGSGGPGGQHANTANTRVEAVFDIEANTTLDPGVRQRLLDVFGPRLRVVCSASRSQRRNRQQAATQLRQQLADALDTPRRRVATRPRRGAIERRIGAKRRRSETKQRRRWQPDD
jgi:ribosome-associated protein